MIEAFKLAESTNLAQLPVLKPFRWFCLSKYFAGREITDEERKSVPIATHFNAGGD